MLTADRVVGALVLVKAVDVVARGPVELPGPLWLAVLALWLLGGLALVAARGPAAARTGWVAVALGGSGLAVDLPLELWRQHLVLLVAVAIAALVATNLTERLLLWRMQLSVLYGVTAIAKVNESFLGGDVLFGAVVAAPLWSSALPPPPTALLIGAGVALIATELVLAVTPWVARLRRPGTLVAACLHAAAIPLVSTDPLLALRLVVFGGTAVLLHAASARLIPIGAGRTPSRVQVQVASRDLGDTRRV